MEQRLTEQQPLSLSLPLVRYHTTRQEAQRGFEREVHTHPHTHTHARTHTWSDDFAGSGFDEKLLAIEMFHDKLAPAQSLAQ